MNVVFLICVAVIYGHIIYIIMYSNYIVSCIIVPIKFHV